MRNIPLQMRHPSAKADGSPNVLKLRCRHLFVRIFCVEPKLFQGSPVHQRGAALVVVLSCLVLVAIVVVAFMAGSATERTSSRSYAEGGRARLLAQSAMDIVQGQIWAATTQTNASWASQPGAIRTFAAGSTNIANVFKLYSSATMVTDGTYNAGTTNAPTEVPADWATRPNEYVDLNRPVFTSAGTNFPILDPSAKGVVAGFDYSASWGSVTNLPMPVQWVYQLKDGTLSAMGSAGKVANATTANPVVGRLAFWTDDDTCKVNINTAGEGVFWDTPRGNSMKVLGGANAAGAARFDAVGEKGLIAYPPVQREYQRYPGHPAQVSLKTAFPTLTAEQLYTLTPRVQSDDLGSNLSDTNNANWRDWSTTFPDSGTAQLGGVSALGLKTQRLYASLDELMFTSTASGSNRTVNQPSAEITPTALSRLQFFMTAYNRAPDVNLFGKPRISMWPIPNLPARRTPIDKWFALCSTIGNESFYFTRQQSQSPSYDYAGIPRNQVLFDYLKQMTSASVPGYLSNFAAKFGADRDQILTEIFDYIRCINLVDLSNTSAASPNVLFAASRNIPPSEVKAFQEAALNFYGFGQVVPIQIDGNRGFGRFDTISEVAILFYPMQWDATRRVREGEGYPLVNSGSNPIAPVPADGIPANAPMYRALVLVEPFNPSQGYVQGVPDYQIQIRGLDQIGVNGASIGFSPDATNVIRGGFNQGGSAGGSTGNAGLGLWFNNTDGWAAATQGNDGESGRPIYPFMSRPFPIPSSPPGTLNGSGEQESAPTFRLHGATELDDANNIEIIIRNKDGLQVQKFLVNFPKALSLPTPGLDGANPTGDQKHKRVRPAALSSGGYRDIIRASDTVISIEPTGVAADMRWLAVQSDVPATAFAPHLNYQNPIAATASDARGANSLRTRLRSVMPNASATFGNLVPNLRTGSPADISSNINGISNTLGDAGDWDTGFGDSRDGAFINKPDEVNTKYKGDASSRYDLPYFAGGDDLRTNIGFDTFFAPNRIVPSPGMFGSLPSRLASDGPWETLLFNPNPAAADSHRGFNNPPDYLWMDLFTMPIIEPYAISEPFSTAGKINLNFQIVPFTYINRSTAINAVLAANRVTAIHDGDGINPAATLSTLASARKIKNFPSSVNLTTQNFNNTDIRHRINVPETLKQFTARFDANMIFKSAAEICSVDLYPLVTASNMPWNEAASGTRLTPDQPAYNASRSNIKTWWSNRRLTGDNVREQPYTTLYQNLTTQSNTYTVHVWAQAIQKPPGSPADEMTSRDAITGEYRVAYSIERFIDPNNPALPDFAQSGSPNTSGFYQFRVNNTKQFAP